MKIKIFRAALLIILITTLCAIYEFSDQNGAESKGISSQVSEFILNFSNAYQEADEKEKKQMLDSANAIIRKLAHFSIYTMVGICVMGLMSKTNIKDSKRILITVIFGIIYASLDELHQIFSPGRTPKVTDVLIDTLGIVVGIILVIIARNIYNKVKQIKSS